MEKETSTLVYSSYFYSLMAYGISLWGNSADINRNFVLQKCAVRAIYNAGSRWMISLKRLLLLHKRINEHVIYIKKNIVINTTVRYNSYAWNKNDQSVFDSRTHKATNSELTDQVTQFYNEIVADMSNINREIFYRAIYAQPIY